MNSNSEITSNPNWEARHMYRIAVLLIVALMFASCSSAPETDTETAETSTAPAVSSLDSASSDSLSGTWTGDWGPSERDRNPVRLELQYDGTTLTGTINPGEGAIPLSRATYDPATMMIMMEA